MLFKRIKFKSFGLTESVVASVIIIIILSAAISLSSNTIKTTDLNASYAQAEHISENIFESINLVKSSGRIYFDAVSRRDDQIVDINCFDTDYYYTHSTCSSGIDTDEYPLSEIPYLNSTYQNDYYLVSADKLNNPSFGDNYFSYKVVVLEPDQCHSSDQVNIPKKKCRKVLTDIKWEEASGEKHYMQGMYLTDWER